MPQQADKAAPVSSQHQKMIGQYLAALKAEKQIAANTALSYEADLLAVARALENRGCSFYDVTADELRASMPIWAGHLVATSQARRISAIKGMMAFATAEAWRQDNPAQYLDRPTLPSRLPKSLSEEDMLKLISTSEEDKSPEGVMLLAIIEILYATGLRVSEMIRLEVSPFAQRRQTLIITGKGNKERMVALTDAALNAAEAWLTIREALPVAVTSPCLFPGKGDAPISRQKVHQLLKDLAHRAGVDADKVSPHILRHSFATHMLNRGADLRSLQMLLGHADISTTEIYTKTQDNRLMGLVRDAHPLADES